MIKQRLKEGCVGRTAAGGAAAAASDDEENMVKKIKNLKKMKAPQRGKKNFSKKKMMKESYLSKFIFAVCSKNYKQADKYLSEEINARLKARISSHI